MTYSNYKTDDFLSDDAFTNWVLQAENDAFWQQFLNENPEQHKAIQNARDFIQASQQVAYPTLPPSVKEAIWGNIRENMKEQPVLKPVYRWRIWGAVAAVFLLTVGGGAWLFFAKKTPPQYLATKKAL